MSSVTTTPVVTKVGVPSTITSSSSHTTTKFTEKTILIQYLIDIGRMVIKKDYVYYIPPISVSVSDNERDEYVTE